MAAYGSEHTTYCPYRRRFLLQNSGWRGRSSMREFVDVTYETLLKAGGGADQGYIEFLIRTVSTRSANDAGRPGLRAARAGHTAQSCTGSRDDAGRRRYAPGRMAHEGEKNWSRPRCKQQGARALQASNIFK